MARIRNNSGVYTLETETLSNVSHRIDINGNNVGVWNRDSEKYTSSGVIHFSRWIDESGVNYAELDQLISDLNSIFSLSSSVGNNSSFVVEGFNACETINLVEGQTGVTLSIGIGSNPVTNELILREDICQYLQKGDVRYYDLNISMDSDNKIFLTVENSVYITNVASMTQRETSNADAAGFRHGIENNNQIFIDRDDNADADINLSLSFIAHM